MFDTVLEAALRVYRLALVDSVRIDDGSFFVFLVFFSADGKGQLLGVGDSFAFACGRVSKDCGPSVESDYCCQYPLLDLDDLRTLWLPGRVRP